MSDLLMPGECARAGDRGTGRRQVATFVLDQLYFGVEVLQVQEVLRYQELTRVPLAPPAVKGLLNLRGQIVAAIDLRCRFGMDDRREGEPPMNVVVRTADGVVSLLVDDIGDVVDLSDTQFEATPDTLGSSTRKLVRGVYKLKDRLLLLLDHERAAVVDEPEGVGRSD